MGEGPGIYVYQDRAGEWRWSLVARNSETVADSAEGYATRSGCLQAVERLLRITSETSLHRHDSPPPGY